MSRRAEIEVFGLSFMDLVCCGMGGVLVLMLIFAALIQQQRGGGRFGKAVSGSELVFEVSCPNEVRVTTTTVPVLSASARGEDGGQVSTLLVMAVDGGAQFDTVRLESDSHSECVGQVIAPPEVRRHPLKFPAQLTLSSQAGAVKLRVTTVNP